MLIDAEILKGWNYDGHLWWDASLTIYALSIGTIIGTSKVGSLWRRHPEAISFVQPSNQYSNVHKELFKNKKWSAYFLVFKYLRKNYNEAVSKRMNAISSLISHDGITKSTKRLRHLCVNIGKQTVGSMLIASFIFAYHILMCKDIPIKNRIRKSLWAFRYPNCWWATIYDINNL